MDYSIYDAAFHSGPARRASKRERHQAVKSFSKCALAILLFILISNAVVIAVEVMILLFFPPHLAEKIVLNPYFAWSMQVLGPYLIAFPTLLLITHGMPRARYKSSKMTASEFITVFIICTGAVMVGSYISDMVSFVIQIFGGAPVVDITANLILETPVSIILLVVVIIGPLVEELIFRKVLIDRMSIYGDRLAVAVSSVMFGIFHGNLSQLFYATALGVALGYVYTKTRKVKYTALLHMLINLFGTLPSVIMLKCDQRMYEIGTKYPDGIIPSDAVADTFEVLNATVTIFSLAAIQYALALTGIILFIVLTAKGAYKFSTQCEISLPKRTVFRASFLNLGMILYILFSLATIILSLYPNILNDLLAASLTS
ncbi:MAG: CPBP family intramembrane metalloprotease [Clostridia bacterium]|nr:CPBP family intramembrane metalloprotease [Clostridia bacterium]